MHNSPDNVLLNFFFFELNCHDQNYWPNHCSYLLSTALIPGSNIFHEHFCADDHNGIQDKIITLIEQVDDEKCFRQRKRFWVHKLDKFYPNGLNQREIYAASRLVNTRISQKLFKF